MTWLLTARLFTFVTTVLLSIIVIALSAALFAPTWPTIFISSYWTFSIFVLTIGLLTVVTIVPIYIIDKLRKGTYFSYIIIEIVWLTVLWILWLSSGSYAAWVDGQFVSQYPDESTCNFSDYLSSADQECGEIKAIMAFSFFLWILLAAYSSTLLGLSIRAYSRGHSVWKTGVRDGTLFYPAEKASTSPAPAHAPPITATVPHSHPPAPPQSLPHSISYSHPPVLPQSLPNSISYSHPGNSEV
ncbi:hypothetical protein BJV78DRAFT_1280249 [Lactifluus subvellereus]|nr:hypothetical protein BJV78DRAFT_1280249 [Lactifluus subvellereus]